jgi:hypothetical protein
MTSDIDGQEQIKDNIRNLKCFHCESTNVYWHYDFHRFECVAICQVVSKY